MDHLRGQVQRLNAEFREDQLSRMEAWRQSLQRAKQAEELRHAREHNPRREYHLAKDSRESPLDMLGRQLRRASIFGSLPDDPGDHDEDCGSDESDHNTRARKRSGRCNPWDRKPRHHDHDDEDGDPTIMTRHAPVTRHQPDRVRHQEREEYPTNRDLIGLECYN